tara:strand:- start:936 stop:1112 length:177 start_codon:yes stop_codon:yes gene_type:complete
MRKNKDNNIKSKVYRNILLIIIVIAAIFFIATSGKFILPQFLQILKIGLPFITKFIGL